MLRAYREVERETAKLVHWYNTGRIHSSIDNMPPIEREAMYCEVIARQGDVVIVMVTHDPVVVA